MIRWSLLACHPVTFPATSHLLIFLFAPQQGLEGKYFTCQCGLLHFRALPQLRRRGYSCQCCTAASTHLTPAVEHPWDNTAVRPQCPSDLVRHPQAGDLAAVPVERPSHAVPCASGQPETVPSPPLPGSRPEPVLPFGAFFQGLRSYSLCTGCRAWVDLTFKSRSTEYTRMPPL